MTDENVVAEYSFIVVERKKEREREREREKLKERNSRPQCWNMRGTKSDEERKKVKGIYLLKVETWYGQKAGREKERKTRLKKKKGRERERKRRGIVFRYGEN